MTINQFNWVINSRNSFLQCVIKFHYLKKFYLLWIRDVKERIYAL